MGVPEESEVESDDVNDYLLVVSELLGEWGAPEDAEAYDDL
ncbi:MAG TPA: hypothetical protein VF601_07335 [Beijerinckiaceae bacterium]|jgi:hypothetical protein